MMGNSRFTALLGVIWIVALISTSYCGGLSPQARDKEVREARDLMKAGRQDIALRKLDLLYEQSPDDPVVVKALFVALVETRDYERAERVMTRYIEQRPEDVRAASDLASLYFRAGGKSEGMGLLERILKIAPEEAWPYQLAVGVLLDNNLDDEALVLVRDARSVLADSTMFALDAAGVHREAGRYDRATREYVLAASGRDPAASVECIMEMARDDEARPGVIQALEAVKAIDQTTDVVRRTLWEVYLIDGSCDIALRELAGVVAEVEAFYRLVPVLGKRSREAGCYNECAEAYALAAAHSRDKAKIPALLLEKGTCQHMAGSVEDALGTYDEVVRKYKDSEWESKARLARGRIYQDLGRLAEAVAEADRVIEAGHDASGRYDGVLLKGDCLIGMGRLEEGFETYDLVGTDWDRRYAQEAFFNLGEIKFFGGDFDDATSYYNVTLRQFADEPRANDAIDRLLLLKASKSGGAYRADLKDFGHALLLRRQGKTEEAKAHLLRLAESDGEAIKAESLKNLSEIYVEDGAFDHAVRTYKLIGDTLDTYLSPSALEAVGDIYLDLGKRDEAITAYEDVILRFPKSVSAGEARRKIEAARRGFRDDT